MACEPGWLGKLIQIHGVGLRRCEDTGSAIGPGMVDIFVRDHQKALDFGRKKRRLCL